jgi:2-desacetyl-2-hydroxyethyl bacteriochlorophyllide A dehydrogenase
MRALVYAAPHVAELCPRPQPTPSSGEVVVRMKRVGICHSDLTLLGGDYILPFNFPVVPGHEWVGEITAVGDGVDEFSEGDRVVGECAVTDRSHFGFTMDGALAEFFIASASWLHHLPDSLDETMGALVEPFTIGYRATKNIDASDTVVVFGACPIGLCAAAAASAKGARVIMIEPDLNRHTLATKLGAEHVIDPRNTEARALILGLTRGRGADVVIEGSGNPTAMANALEVACFGGRVVYVGIKVGAIAQAPLGLMVEKSLHVRGNVGSTGTWPAALRFLDRTGLDLTPLVTRTFPLSEAVKALDAAEDRKTNVKVHVVAD